MNIKPIPADYTALNLAIHILRNPYGFSEPEVREARLLAANFMEAVVKRGPRPKADREPRGAECPHCGHYCHGKSAFCTP